MKLHKKIILLFWLLIVFGFWFAYFLLPNFFTKQWLVEFFQQFGNYIVFVYILVSCFRGIFLLPATVLIFVGAVFLKPVSLFFISMGAIVVSSSLVYYFGDFLGVDKEIKNPKYVQKIKKLEQKINQNGFLIVALWSFFPLVPTDIICYIAGTSRMKYTTFILGVIIGEIPLVLFYVLIASGVVQSFSL